MTSRLQYTILWVAPGRLASSAGVFKLHDVELTLSDCLHSIVASTASSSSYRTTATEVSGGGNGALDLLAEIRRGESCVALSDVYRSGFPVIAISI